MNATDLLVMELVECLVNDYAGRVTPTRIITAVHTTCEEHPGASAGDLSMAARAVLDGVVRQRRPPKSG
jgi:hypothetical protein